MDLELIQSLASQFAFNFFTTTCAVFAGTILAMKYLEGKK